jgi:hypothetical protein
MFDTIAPTAQANRSTLFDKTFTGELFDGTNTESFYYFVTQDLEARGALSLFDLDNEAYVEPQDEPTKALLLQAGGFLRRSMAYKTGKLWTIPARQILISSHPDSHLRTCDNSWQPSSLSSLKVKQP